MTKTINPAAHSKRHWLFHTGAWIRRHAGFDQPLHVPSRAFPAAWRWPLNWALSAVLVFLCFFGWWATFEFVREWLWLVIDILGFLSLFVPQILRRWKRLPDLPPPEDNQPGGLFYVSFIVAMVVWWTLSSYLAGTIAAPMVWQDHTLQTQYWLSFIAIFIVWFQNGRFWRIDLQPRKWIVSYVVFSGAILMMIADTDYQRRVAIPPISWELWIRWRCLNYGLIVPYLAAGIAVVNGWSLARVCAIGAVAVPCLMIIVWFSGVPI